MKKFLWMILVIAFVLPFAVFADGDEVVAAEESREVKVYFFRGEGCPHCEEAEEFFSSIEEEYGNLFEVIDYETWYNEENAALMTKVGEARNEEIGGVPFILIGNKSWNGFTEQWGNEMLAEIKSQYEIEVADRYDIMQLINTGTTGEGGKVEEKSIGSDILGLIVILLVAGGIGFGIYKARQEV